MVRKKVRGPRESDHAKGRGFGGGVGWDLNSVAVGSLGAYKLLLASNFWVQEPTVGGQRRGGGICAAYFIKQLPPHQRPPCLVTTQSLVAATT